MIVRLRARRHRTVLAAVLTVAALALAGCGAGTAASAGGGAKAGSEPSTVGLTVDGRARSYLLEPAQNLASGQRAPLVVVLHQEGGTAAGVAAETDLQDLRTRGVTLVYPTGVEGSWDAGLCCGKAKQQGVDDVKFLDSVLADVDARSPVDPARTAFVGYSSGGMLTYQYVCSRPKRLAVAVVVSGSLESPCAAGVTVPDLLALHGKLDQTVGLNQAYFVNALGLAPQPVATTLRELTRSADCDSSPVLSSQPQAEIRTWQGCRGGTVESRVVDGVGHGWAKLGATRATDDFLTQHLLDRKPA